MPTIYQGYQAILKYGTPKQKEIIRGMKASLIYIHLAGLGGNASGDTGLQFPAQAVQEVINTGPIDIIKGYGQLEMKIDYATAKTAAGLEGTLIHESRHAYHQARAISDFSAGKSKPDPNGFEIEYAANVAYVHYVAQAVRLNHPEKNVLVNEAVNVLGVAKQIGNRIVVDEIGIRNRLNSPSYNVNDRTGVGMGTPFSQHWKVYPKSPMTVIGGAAGKIGG